MTYKIKGCKVVFNPYDFLPAYGETSIDLKFSDSLLELNVYYDTNRDNKEGCLRLLFDNAVFYKLESFPGVSSINAEYDYDDSTVGSLIQFLDSDFKDVWERHFNNLFKFAHYKIFLLGVNKSLEVVCRDIHF